MLLQRRSWAKGFPPPRKVPLFPLLCPPWSPPLPRPHMTPSSSDPRSGRDKSDTRNSAAASKVVTGEEFETLSTESGTHVVQAGADLMVRFRVPENPETEATRRRVRIRFSWHVQAPKQQIGFAVCACESDGSSPRRPNLNFTCKNDTQPWAQNLTLLLQVNGFEVE